MLVDAFGERDLPGVAGAGAGAVARLRQLRAGAALAVACREAVAMLAVAAAIAAWPYIRNVELFGNPVSDNPVVFALASARLAVLHGDAPARHAGRAGSVRAPEGLVRDRVVLARLLAGVPAAARVAGLGPRRAPRRADAAERTGRPLCGTAGDAPALAVAGLVLVVYHLLAGPPSRCCWAST
ncbi:MAG: hypothetical protein U1F49_20960 [Rubrivivax sp.]